MFDRVGCGIARVDDCRKQNPADLGRRQQGADAAVGRLVRRKQHGDVHARLVMLGGQRREIARAAEIDEDAQRFRRDIKLRHVRLLDQLDDGVLFQIAFQNRVPDPERDEKGHGEHGRNNILEALAERNERRNRQHGRQHGRPEVGRGRGHRRERERSQPVDQRQNDLSQTAAGIVDNHRGGAEQRIERDGNQRQNQQQSEQRARQQIGQRRNDRDRVEHRERDGERKQRRHDRIHNRRDEKLEQTVADAEAQAEKIVHQRADEQDSQAGEEGKLQADRRDGVRVEHQQHDQREKER